MMKMRLIDFKTNEDFTFSNLRCKLLIKKKLLEESGRIQLVGDNRYELISGDMYDFSVVDLLDARVLTDKMKQYTYNLVYVTPIKNTADEFFLHIAFFYDAKREARLNIVLSQNVKETLKRKHLVADNQDFEENVKQNFVLYDGTDPCYAYTMGKYKQSTGMIEQAIVESDSSEPKPKDDVEDQFDEVISESFEQENAFKSIRLFGKDYSLLTQLKGSDDELFLYAESVDTINRITPPMALRIGDLSFKDGETYISEKIKKELENTSGYLDIWDKYTSTEGDFLLEKARLIGEIQINCDTINKGDGGLIVYPEALREEQSKLIGIGDYLQITSNLPAYIEDANMTWANYKKEMEMLKDIRGNSVRGTLWKIKRIDKLGHWVIESQDNDTLPKGVITYSVFGDMQQIIRREAARELIENGEAAFPSLGLVIEGKKPESVIEVKRQPRIEPITAFIKEKIFKYEPRPKQRDAIDIALNTPDIAIIQGPPGTGKTTVITAIVERLNEIADKRKDNRGQVLVTSFQHDAVRNVIGRLSINSLPTIKFGKQGSEDISQEKAIEEWCYNYALRLKERNPSIQQTAEQKEFERKHEVYLASPNDANALSFLKYAQKINFSNEIYEETNRIIDEIDFEESSSTTQLIGKIRRLRTTHEGFLDDGPETTDDLLADLEDVMRVGISSNDNVFQILQKAADTVDDDIDDDLLEALTRVKHELLMRCMPKPSYRIEKPRSDVLSIYTKMLRTMSRPQNAEDEILFNLLNELENNVSGVEEAVANYNFVYAATAQQSEGKDIRNAKDIGQREHPVYDTVIIDEAARVNPGDLMIPMAQAKRRIILVGDHRQLPHIYDEEIFEAMRDNGNNVGKEIVKISMFQYLKERAEELYRIDGIQRTITLDAQYRMNPELGEFINKNFYAPYGEGFESPLPAAKFAQDISTTPYLWADIPHNVGNEDKDGTSRKRLCEANFIVDQICNYVLSEGGSKLSYGIITFYSAQAKLIKKLLKDKDISERVRVGSVDAFQGMEFDVIFLSVVRTHTGFPIYNQTLLNMDVSMYNELDDTYIEWQKYRDDIGLKYYGFLTSENRLCVALSRQKRLLIVVGDSKIFHFGEWGNLAEKCVPALKHFYELCEQNGAVTNVQT